MQCAYHIFKRQGTSLAYSGALIDLSPDLALARWLLNNAKSAVAALTITKPQGAWQYLVRCGGERDEHYHYAVLA